MYPQKQSIVLFDNVTPVAITSSTDATPVVVTATAHGLKTGQRVLIQGHATNIAANGIFQVGVVTANTFQLLDEITGVSVAGSGAGSGSGGICMLAPQIAHLGDFKNAVLQIGTSGGATVTLKMAGSLGKTNLSSTPPRGALPNFGATVAPSNPYSFLQMINLDTGAALNGATGIVVAGTDVNIQLEVNTNLMLYMTLIPTTWSAGAFTAKLLLQTAV